MKNQNNDVLRSTRYVIAASDLPLLTGSASEIEWAQTIRTDMLITANSQLAQLRSLVHAGGASAPLDAAFRASLRLREKTSAAWWIASRHLDMDSLLKELAHRSYAMEYGGN